jgi:hypothetical protein
VGFHALRSVDPDERGWRRCHPSRRPHMPFPERPSRQAVFGREINRLLLSNAPTENACVGRSIQDAHRGSWDFPAVSPRLRRAILSRAAGAILPWAFVVLSQVCRTCARAGCVLPLPRRTRAFANGRIVCMPLHEPPTPGAATSMMTRAARIRSWALANVWRRRVGRR